MSRFVLVLMLLVALPTTVHAQLFTRVTEGDLVNDIAISQGASWGDYDNDGDLDLFVANFTGPRSDQGPTIDAANQLYQNNGDGTFTRVLIDFLSSFQTGSNLGFWIDYDNDGWLDLLVTNGFGGPATNTLHRNQGDGTFAIDTDVAFVQQRMNSLGTSWADYDNDGDLDMFAPTVFANPNYLYRNDGDGVFTTIVDVPFAGSNQNSQMGTWVDYDSDGDEDLYLINFSIGSNANQFFRNQYQETGSTSFEPDSSVAMFSDNNIDYSFGANWIDYDNDGDLDGYLSTLFIGNPNGLYRRNGPGSFERITAFGNQAASDGFSTASSCWGDYDNDGDLDLLNVVNKALANPAAFGIGSNEFYLNDGTGELKRRNGGFSTSGYFFSCASADYDQDGDLDLYITVSGTSAINDGGANLLYRNEEGNINNWISIDLRGRASNSFGIGAKVWVTATVNGREHRQRRQISGNPSTLRGQDGYRVHVGLGDASTVDLIEVEWPSGTTDRLENLDINQFLVITEGVGVVATEPSTLPETLTLEANYPNPFMTETTIAYTLSQATSVRLVITDMLGREVVQLKDELETQGRHIVHVDASSWAPGMYFYRLETPSRVLVRPMHVLH